MKILSKNRTLLGLVLLVLCLFIINNIFIQPKKINFKKVYLSPDFQLSDEQLAVKYSDSALKGDRDACYIMYDRFFWRNHDFDKAKPYLEIAASHGDEDAIKILRDPAMELKKMEGK